MAVSDDETPDYDIDGNDVFYIQKKNDEIEETDPFAKSTTEIKELSGVAGNFKRKVTNMEKRFDGIGGAKSKKEEENEITGYNAFNVVVPPYNLDYLARLYTAAGPHYAAIGAKTANIVGLGHEWIESRTTKRKMDAIDDEERADKLRKKLARAKDDLEDWIETLNEEDAFTEILIKVWIDYETTGNGYLEVGRTNQGTIGYIGHIPSTTVRIRRERDGFVQIISNKAVFFRNFGKKDANPLGNDNKPNELIHIKRYAPGSGYYGVPDVIAAKQPVAGNEFVARFNLDYFENKAVPRHVVVLQGATINPRLAKNILEFFETGLKGQHHRSLFVPLPASTNEKKISLEFKPVEAGVQEASFKDYRKQNTNEILMVHRVPITKVSVGDSVSLAVAKDADKTFKEQVCAPQQKIFETKLNRIIKEYTDMFYLKLTEMTLTDEDTKSKIYERFVKMGAMSGNEVRTETGRPSRPDGEELVDLNAAAKIAEQRNEMQANRERDSVRSANATDSAGEARSPKGEGRTT